jgi:hypothetical protein
MYLSITLCTGELLENFLCLYITYFPVMEERLLKYPYLVPFMPGKHADEEDEDDEDGEGEAQADGRSRAGSHFSGVNGPVGRSESTNATGTSGKVKGSKHDMGSVFEAFVDIGTRMSFSAPNKPSARSKSSKMSRAGGSEKGGSRAPSMAEGAPSDGNMAELVQSNKFNLTELAKSDDGVNAR